MSLCIAQGRTRLSLALTTILSSRLRYHLAALDESRVACYRSQPIARQELPDAFLFLQTFPGQHTNPGSQHLLPQQAWTELQHLSPQHLCDFLQQRLFGQHCSS